MVELWPGWSVAAKDCVEKLRRVLRHAVGLVLPDASRFLLDGHH